MYTIYLKYFLNNTEIKIKVLGLNIIIYQFLTYVGVDAKLFTKASRVVGSFPISGKYFYDLRQLFQHKSARLLEVYENLLFIGIRIFAILGSVKKDKKKMKVILN